MERTCPFHGVDTDGESISSHQPSSLAANTAVAKTAIQPIAWESGGNILVNFFRTIGQVLFKPNTAFLGPARPGLWWALSFGLILGSIGSAAQLCWDNQLGEIALSSKHLAAYLALAPITALGNIFIGAGLGHLGLLMVGGAKKGFHATYRVSTYSCAGGIFCLIPYTGIHLYFVWGLVICLCGLSSVHGITKLRAFGGLVCTFLMLLLFMVFIFIQVQLFVEYGKA